MTFENVGNDFDNKCEQNDDSQNSKIENEKEENIMRLEDDVIQRFTAEYYFYVILIMILELI